MNKKKLFVLVLAMVLAFTTGCSDIVVKAFPTPYHVGYFTGNTDDPGTAVLPAWGGDTSNCYANGLALPTWIESADQFINFIVCKLNQPDSQSHVGAAFIISTMSGMKNINPGPTEINEFAARVRYAESQGWINWHAPFECITPNTYYQNNGSPDVAAYSSCGTSSEMITFSRDGSLSNRYIIKRLCANPLGDMAPIPAPWNAVGSTTVTDNTPDPGDTPTNITTRPGEVLHFNNRITNNGPGVSYNWYALYGQPNATAFTGEYFNNTTLTGPPVMTRTDPGELKFDWGGSPGGSVGADNFSVRWTKTEYLPAGTYGFSVVMDDGVRLYVDGNLIIDHWVDQGPTYYYNTANLGDGNHTIKVEYYERGGGATAYMWYNTSVQGGIDAGSFTPGQTKNFLQDVPVPANAPPDSKICRRILWDWKNSAGSGDFAPYGGSWGMGAAACATVVIPYK
ncbi:MAG TPA: PA14 domain-containing protein, partial [Magnetospirillaceae bacterium]|nr:PA14 domain-containing protein [Magnetospirillaceae bacterium]